MCLSLDHYFIASRSILLENDKLVELKVKLEAKAEIEVEVE